MQSTTRYTKEGYDNLLKEEADLTQKRVEAVAEVKRTRDMGDLSENAAYRAAKWKLGGIDRRLRQIKKQLDQAEVVETPKDGTIGIGSKVILQKDGQTVEYEIVGGMESDILKGKISERSPLGKNLLGKKVNDIVNFHSPAGLNTYQIIKIQ